MLYNRKGLLLQSLCYFRCHISTVKRLQQQIFMLYCNLLEIFPNIEIIATQICPDIENREMFINKFYSMPDVRPQPTVFIRSTRLHKAELGS